MTSPWTPQPSYPPATTTPTAGWGPLVGWLLLLVCATGSLLTVFAGVPWVSGQRPGGGDAGLDAGWLVNRGMGLLPFAVLAAVVGLVVATWFGLAAVPGGRGSRVAVAVAVLLLLVLLTVFGLGDDSVDPAEALGLTALLFWLPGAVLLLMVWRGARRGAAWTAAVFAALAALGALLVLLNGISGLGTPGPGAWLALLFAAGGLAGGVLQLRWAPRRPRALEPGDPGWTA